MSEVDYVGPSDVLPQQAESVTRGTIFLSAATAAVFAVNGVIQIVAGRVLLPEVYGRFATAFLILTWLNTIVASIILPGLRKIVSEEHRRFGAAVSFAAARFSLVALSVGFVFCIISHPLSLAFGDRQLAILFLLVGLQIPFVAAVSLSAILLTAVRRFMRSSIVKTSGPVLGAAGAITFLHFGFGAPGAVRGIVAGSVVAAVLAVVMLASERPRFGHDPYPQMSRRVAYWTSITLPATLAAGTLLTVDMWLVKGILRNSAAPGLYAAAYSLARFPMCIVYGLSGAVFPRLSGALHRNEHELARFVSLETMRFIMILIVPICFITAASSSEIITFVFSSKYAGGSDALTVLIIALFFLGQTVVTLGLLSAANRRTSTFGSRADS